MPTRPAASPSSWNSARRHTVADGKLYRKGMLDFKAEIAASEAALDFEKDPEALDRREQLRAMPSPARGHPLRRAPRRNWPSAAAAAADPERKQELLKVADVCRRVPPTRLATSTRRCRCTGSATSRSSPSSMLGCLQPGPPRPAPRPFYEAGWPTAHSPAIGTRAARVLFIKFNNHTAPPKWGDGGRERHLHDFANINLAGLLRDGSDGSNEVTHCCSTIDEMHLLQPSSNMQVSRKTPRGPQARAARHPQRLRLPVALQRDAVVEEQLRQGKTLEDAREGAARCVEVGAFGKEAYILTGYFNL